MPPGFTISALDTCIDQQAVKNYSHPGDEWTTGAEYTSQQTDTSIKASPGPHRALHITDIYVQVAGAVTITLEEDGAPDVAKFVFYGQAAGDGATLRFAVPIKLAVNAALLLTSSTGATFFIVVNGYTKYSS